MQPKRSSASSRPSKKSASNHGTLPGICWRDEERVDTVRLLPLASSPRRQQGRLPMTNEPPQKVAAGVARHYVFHKLLSLLLRSLHVENHLRLLQMENALRHLDRGRDELRRLRDQGRQEEIVEEIELILQQKPAEAAGPIARTKG
jgi:F-type H+-transporting ATPase subunit gamma